MSMREWLAEVTAGLMSDANLDIGEAILHTPDGGEEETVWAVVNRGGGQTGFIDDGVEETKHATISFTGGTNPGRNSLFEIDGEAYSVESPSGPHEDGVYRFELVRREYDERSVGTR